MGEQLHRPEELPALLLLSRVPKYSHGHRVRLVRALRAQQQGATLRDREHRGARSHGFNRPADHSNHRPDWLSHLFGLKKSNN